MLGKLRKVSHMAWYCVLTYRASQQAAAVPKLSTSPCQQDRPGAAEVAPNKSTRGHTTNGPTT
eukprot:2991503-Amphidinium_carterae.1